MSEELEKFDPSQVMENLKEKIKATMVGMIPESHLEGMIKEEVNNFFHKTSKVTFSKDEEASGQWRIDNKHFSCITADLTPFQAMVWDHCAVQLGNVMKKKFNQEYLESMIDDTKYLNRMDKVVAGNTEKAISAFFKGVMESQSMNVANEIRSQLSSIQGY